MQLAPAGPDPIPGGGRSYDELHLDGSVTRRVIAPSIFDEPFDQKYMVALFDRGYDLASRSSSWVEALRGMELVTQAHNVPSADGHNYPMMKEQNKAITATAISAVPIQPRTISWRLALNRPISPAFPTITIIMAMIGTATMPLSTALQTSM